MMPTELVWYPTDTGNGEYTMLGRLTACFWRDANAPTAALGWRVNLLLDNGLGSDVVRDGRAKNDMAAKSLAASYIIDGRRA